MFKHVVFWKLKEKANGKSRPENIKLLQEKIGGLTDVIKEIKKIEIGPNCSDSKNAFDVCLYSEFDNRADFEVYLNHPDHQNLIPFVRGIVNEKVEVDYLI